MTPAFDEHRNLSPSSGSFTLTFDKPYAVKPFVQIDTESVVMDGRTYNDTDGDGNFEEVTISFQDAGGNAVNPNFHAKVNHEPV